MLCDPPLPVWGDGGCTPGGKAQRRRKGGPQWRRQRLGDSRTVWEPEVDRSGNSGWRLFVDARHLVSIQEIARYYYSISVIIW